MSTLDMITIFIRISISLFSGYCMGKVVATCILNKRKKKYTTSKRSPSGKHEPTEGDGVIHIKNATTCKHCGRFIYTDVEWIGIRMTKDGVVDERFE